MSICTTSCVNIKVYKIYSDSRLNYSIDHAHIHYNSVATQSHDNSHSAISDAYVGVHTQYCSFLTLKLNQYWFNVCMAIMNIKQYIETRNKSNKKQVKNMLKTAQCVQVFSLLTVCKTNLYT